MRTFVTLLLIVSPAVGQVQAGPRVERNNRLLNERLAGAPALELVKSEVALMPLSLGWRIDQPSSVAVGKDGVFYLLQRGVDADPVIAFNRDGKVLRSWGRGLYTIAHSIRVDPEGNVWTVDAGSSQIYKFSSMGQQLLHIDVGEMPDGPHPFRGTSDIAFAADGNLLISDGYGNARILEYTADGGRVREFGRLGTGPGELELPHGIAIDERDIVYVADRENGRIQRFLREGEFLDLWDGLGKAYCLELDGDAVWTGTHPLDQPPDGEGSRIFRLDRDSGEVVGVVDSLGTHSIAVTPEGELITGVWPDRVIRLHPGR